MDYAHSLLDLPRQLRVWSGSQQSLLLSAVTNGPLRGASLLGLLRPGAVVVPPSIELNCTTVKKYPLRPVHGAVYGLSSIIA